jgi:O-antigen/teichoic acid export membrane protein
MSKLFKNIIYNLIGQGLVLIISFAAVKYVFGRLGAEALGIIYFTVAVNAVLATVLEMGISSTIVREISGHFDSDKKYIEDFVRTFSLFYWSIYLLASLIIFFMAPFFVHHWIRLSEINPSTAIYILRILGISSVMGLLRSFYTSLIRGLQKMGIVNFIDVVTSALQQFGAILILILGGGLLPVVYWFAASHILRVVIYFFFCLRSFSFSAVVPKASLNVLKRNFKFAFKTALISFFSIIHTQADKIIISKLLPVATLGYYSLAYSGVSQGTTLTDSVSQAVYPSFSALYKAGDKNSLMAQYHKLQDFVCFCILPIFAMIVFVTIPLFSYIFNRQVADLLLLPVTLLCIGFYMNGTVTVPYMFSLAVGKPGIGAKFNFFALFVVLPLTIILIYFFGLTGAGLAWVFYNIFSYSYAMPRICKECINIKPKDWFFHITRIFILAILTYGLSWLVLSAIKNHSIIALTLAYLSASVAYSFFSYFLITKELRKTIIYYFKLIFRLK